MTNDALSRQTSRKPLLPHQDDDASITSFPELPPLSPTTSHPSISVTEHLNGLLDQSEPTMFDERPDVDADDPRTLSAADHAVVQRVMDHYGGVNLTQRLAKSLAQRDAHVTALQRLCEEFKVPETRIIECGSRVKQAERRRLSLVKAANESMTTSGAYAKSETSSIAPSTASAGGTIRGLTKFFGGVPQRRETLEQSIAPTTKPRTQSIDSRSVASADTSTSLGWTATLFNGGANRRPSKATREPVELQAQHDQDTLPPTLTDTTTQDPQEADWNRFILKLLKARQSSGQQEAQGTMLGASHFGREGAPGRAKQETLHRLIIGGIPNRLRHAIWMELSNTYALIDPDAYRSYLALGTTEVPAEEIDAILKDVPRTLTEQYSYYVDKGHTKLKNLLVAFVAKYPDLGYTQGLNMIAGHLLLAIPAEEDAFWVLCNMVDNYFPAGYFSRDAPMDGALADNAVLREYVREIMPKLDEHLTRLDIDSHSTFQPGWHLTALSSHLPKIALQRVWDVWLCLPKQQTFLFNVVLAMLKLREAEILRLKSDTEYNAFDWRVPDDAAKAEELVKAALQLRKRVDAEQVATRREAEVRKMRRSSSVRGMWSAD
ncbi:hypothetical protein LTR95_003025 [Oleoguttula sp. CCFEE 5521]